MGPKLKLQIQNDLICSKFRLPNNHMGTSVPISKSFSPMKRIIQGAPLVYPEETKKNPVFSSAASGVEIWIRNKILTSREYEAKTV